MSAMTTTDDPLVKRIETVGRLLPHVQARVVDPGDWTKVLPVGQRGELAVSGYLVMKGYWGDEKRTKEAMLTDSEGKVWMHVSDLFALSRFSASCIQRVSFFANGMNVTDRR